MSADLLTSAERERLALLLEEMGEAQHAIGKVLRHGYPSVNPDDEGSGPDNRERLETELGHVRHAMILLCEAGDLSKKMIHHHADMKRIAVRQWLWYQGDEGR